MKPVDAEPWHNGNLSSVVNFYSSEDPKFMICVGRNLLPTEENFRSLRFLRSAGFTVFETLCVSLCV